MEIKTASDFLKLHGSDITRSFLHTIFVLDNKKKRLFEPNEKIILDEKLLKEYNSEILLFKNAKDILGKETTIGRLLFNLAAFNFEFSVYENQSKTKEVEITTEKKVSIKPYVSFRHEMIVNKSSLNDVYSEITEQFVDGILPAEVLNNIIDRIQWFSLTLVAYMNPSMDVKSVAATPEVRKMRDKILKDNESVIENNDVIYYNKNVETEMIKKASEIMDKEKSTGKIVYDSGAQGSITANYKLTALARGVVTASDDPNKFTINKSNLSDGVSKEEVVTAGDIAVQGSIGRAIATRQGGYLVKQFQSAFQSVVLDEAGTDCKTPYTLDINIDGNFKDYIYRYVMVGGKSVLIGRGDKEKYTGKTVKLRSPFYCQTKKICNVCAGDMLYKLGIRNIGLSSAGVGSTLLNGALKAFHTLSVNSETYNIFDFIYDPIPFVE